MDFTVAREQISNLLECDCFRPEWNDVLEEHFSEAYWVEDIQIFPNGAFIWIDWPSMSFTFKDVVLEFYLQMWSYTESGILEHGVCLSSGKGKFIYSGENIIGIDDIEIELYPQSIIEPEYNYGQYCWNIAIVLTSLKNAYPYPDDNELANWAGVSVNTIKRWQEPRTRAKISAVEQLMDTFKYQRNNIADILL